jgi:hypothetical protein
MTSSLPPRGTRRGWRRHWSACVSLRITNGGLLVIGIERAGSAPAPALDEDAAGLAYDSPPPSPKAPSSPRQAPDSLPAWRATAADLVEAWEASQLLDAALASLCAILASPRPTSSRHCLQAARRHPAGGGAGAAAPVRRRDRGTGGRVDRLAPHTVRGFVASLRTRHGIEVTVLVARNGHDPGAPRLLLRRRPAGRSSKGELSCYGR